MKDNPGHFMFEQVRKIFLPVIKDNWKFACNSIS